MKKLILVSLLIISLMMSGCSLATDDGSIKVYTSFYTIYDLTQKIAGDNVKVYNIMSQGGDAHHFEPSTKDIINLNKADVFIYNGLGMEHWVDSVLNTLENPKLITVKASEGVEVLGEDEQHTDHTDEHDQAFDPHIWLSPKNTKIILYNIKQALIQVDPDNASEYESNYEKYALECDKLDNEYITALQGFEKRDIVVTHQAFSYLCKEYNLHQIALLGLHSEAPNPLRQGEIIDEIKKNNIKIIFYEPAHGKTLAESFKQDIASILIAPLNPLESLTDSEIKNKADYFSVMRQNLKQITTALQRQNGV